MTEVNNETLSVEQVWREKRTNSQMARVLHEGLPVSTLEWVPFDNVIQLVESQIPPNIFTACNGS